METKKKRFEFAEELTLFKAKQELYAAQIITSRMRIDDLLIKLYKIDEEIEELEMKEALSDEQMLRLDDLHVQKLREKIRLQKQKNCLGTVLIQQISETSIYYNLS